jgi:hypothetical protein
MVYAFWSFSIKIKCPESAYGFRFLGKIIPESICIWQSKEVMKENAEQYSLNHYRKNCLTPLFSS